MSERKRIKIVEKFRDAPTFCTDLEIHQEGTGRPLTGSIALYDQEKKLLEDMVRAYNICVGRGLL